MNGDATATHVTHDFTPAAGDTAPTPAQTT